MSKKKKKHENSQGNSGQQNATKRENRPAKHRSNHTILIWTITATVAFSIVAGLGAFAVIGYERLYENRIFPGVRILGVRLDGLTEEEARNTVNDAIDTALRDGLRFRYLSQEITLGASTVAQEDPDASRDFVRFDIDGPIRAAKSFGRTGNIFRDTVDRWSARVKTQHLDVPITLDTKGITDGITNATKDVISPVRNASLKITWNESTQKPVVDVLDGADGQELQLESTFQELQKQSEHLSFAPIDLQARTISPAIKRSDLDPLIAKVDEMVAYAPITLTYDGDAYTVSKERFASWMTAASDSNGSLALTIDPKRFGEDIRNMTDIEQVAKKGTLVIENGAIASFEAGSIGYRINDERTLAGIHEGLGSTTTFALVIDIEEAAIGGNDPERLGIKEIIGIGRSNFSGSPTNRRKNIAIGVSRVNGSLIAPGEEFSLLTTLGPITADKGWLAELVIKGNKTTPELGGGLCQIGTTAFRAAVNSGMKITERRNHSYRVSYYEPAGTDATIYEPAPDFKFRNDTAHHVLINAYTKGDEVIYEFWGTKDGRKVTVGDPRIYNITAPPPKKLVETTDLAPGKMRCTESAHNGADAAFDYKVEYADGTIHEETFHSHYRPWQAVCLVGVETLSTEQEPLNTTNDSTDGSENTPPPVEPPPATNTNTDASN